ncbi:MAG TPA: SPOR domain-containing protein [Novosphingobium sp.]|nr:SPOR domain-containing protein [Novosphingobium sp.]HMP56027.1 SPOR domain-containing protein [Novosphingobium sp.]
MAGSHTPDDGRERNEADEPFETQDGDEVFTEDEGDYPEDRLALDEDDSLPWLESGDEALEDEPSDTGRILGLVLMGLVALAAIVGGIWWATHRTADPELVADGSTIEAPATPFKEAPKDPGGKTFDGTGDSSFAVSEGQTRPARLGEGDAPAAPRPSIDLAPAPKASAPAVAASAAAAPAETGGAVGVQVGAYSTRAKAEEGWTKLAANPALSGVRHRVVEGQADIGTVYRLQALAADRDAASALCSRLKAAGIACQVKN